MEPVHALLLKIGDDIDKGADSDVIKVSLSATQHGMNVFFSGIKVVQHLTMVGLC